MTRTSIVFGVAIAGLAFSIGCSSDDLSPAAAAAPVAAAAPAVTAEMLEKGHGIYKSNCAGCHGESGRGDGPAAVSFKPAPRDHTNRAYMDKLTDKNIADVIQMGGAIKGMPLMPSSPQIRGAQMEALVAYVRSLSRK